MFDNKWRFQIINKNDGVLIESLTAFSYDDLTLLNENEILMLEMTLLTNKTYEIIKKRINWDLKLKK